MEAPNPITAVADPSTSSEISTPHEEDARHGHFAGTTSPGPKSTASTALLTPSNQAPDVNAKEMKSIGSRLYDECHEQDSACLRLRSSRIIKGKEPLSARREEKKPLRLLDLPMDILKDIVKEVTHTNDLTSLALCHSALHRLTTPHIYSRFDIVWPDSSSHAEPRSGVDALTYGLATLVMAEEIFGEGPGQKCAQPSNRFSATGLGRATETTIRRRRGNHYAQFTKKFSLGNGPSDWVQEYLIIKEGGKMLGTLVALAVARMRSLETFVWDMPTGILRDVWLALSSLGDRNDGLPCRLEKVWVRWHDNTSADVAADGTGSVLPPPPINLAAMSAPPLQTTANVLTLPMPSVALDRVEHPSFSVLPPLKSLSVLDIDELTYLDEMAVLIGRSIHKLRELRVGIARHAITRGWVTVWEGETLQQVDPNYPTAGCLTIGDQRLGGVLGVLTGFVCDMRKPRLHSPDRQRRRRVSGRGQNISSNEDVVITTVLRHSEVHSPSAGSVASLADVLPGHTSNESELSSLGHPSPLDVRDQSVDEPRAALAELGVTVLDALSEAAQQEPPALSPLEAKEVAHRDFLQDQPTYLHNMLQLESLELERVPIAVPVLQKAIDWTRLTCLTLLHCSNHEQLWKTLRKTFAPTLKSPAYPSPRRPTSSTPRKLGRPCVGEAGFDYKLNLKKIHTNTVSPAFISFAKETLAPNSLEVLFLQEARGYHSSIEVDAIFRGPLKRHRGSLKKVLIDSAEKRPDGLHGPSSRWRRWMLSREILAFICSGKMPALRELGMAMDYRDWHFFLQRLPSIPHLRSLFLPFLADHVHGANVDPRELALQIVDIIALRPEVELCYMGIANKCFEVLENRRDSDARSESQLGMVASGTGDPDSTGSEDGQEEDDGGDDEDVEEVDDHQHDHDDEADDTESEEDDDDDAEDDDDDAAADADTDSDEEGGASAADKIVGRLRLREILFYDDKVAIFKARHGRL